MLIYNRDLDNKTMTKGGFVCCAAALCSSDEISLIAQINQFLLLLACSLNECYFAGKGTALMLGSNERLQRGDGRRFSQISNELSASQTSIGSSSDIQQHLQSMFYLLRPEETLKMVSLSFPDEVSARNEKCP